MQVAHMGGAKPNSKLGLRRVLHRGGISRTSVRKGIYHTPRPALTPKQSGLCIPMLYRVTESLCVKMCIAMGVLLFADVHRYTSHRYSCTAECERFVVAVGVAGISLLQQTSLNVTDLLHGS